MWTAADRRVAIEGRRVLTDSRSACDRFGRLHVGPPLDRRAATAGSAPGSRETGLPPAEATASAAGMRGAAVFNWAAWPGTGPLLTIVSETCALSARCRSLMAPGAVCAAARREVSASTADAAFCIRPMMQASADEW